MVNLAGDLGNQMFQYACGQALAVVKSQEFGYSTNILQPLPKIRYVDAFELLWIGVFQSKG